MLYITLFIIKLSNHFLALDAHPNTLTGQYSPTHRMNSLKTNKKVTEPSVCRIERKAHLRRSFYRKINHIQHYKNTDNFPTCLHICGHSHGTTLSHIHQYLYTNKVVAINQHVF